MGESHPQNWGLHPENITSESSKRCFSQCTRSPPPHVKTSRKTLPSFIYRTVIILLFCIQGIHFIGLLYCASLLYHQFSKLYRNTSKADNPPHIFAVADQSYQAMMHYKHNQVRDTPPPPHSETDVREIGLDVML